MKIYGQLEQACVEQVSSDPSGNTQGRIFTNTTDGRTKIDDGVNKRALLRNDQKLVVGNDGTAANNIRLQKATSGVLQITTGADATAEGSRTNSLQQLSYRDENLTSGTLPANGNAGYTTWLTDQKVSAEDDGTNWRKHIPEFIANDASTGGTVTLAAIVSSVVRLTNSITTISNIPAGFSGQRVSLINRTGSDVAISHDFGSTTTSIYTGTGANLVFKNNSSLPFYYDGTTQRWQVVGEVAGAAAGGGGLPNSSITIQTSNYTVLITDNIILADVTSGSLTLTLPSASGNSGKVFVIEKIAGRIDTKVAIAGTINGISNDELWALNTPLILVSDGTNWKTESAPSGQLFFTYQTSPLPVAATSTANVTISTFADNSVIDSITLRTGNTILLKNQTSASENGIYTVGATPGTTARHSSYSTFGTLVDLIVYSDFYNHTTTGAGSSAANAGGSPNPTTSSTPTNDRKFFRQTNNVLTSFATASYSAANTGISFAIKVPTNVTMADFEICPFGGPGAAGAPLATGSSGGGGSGGLPVSFSSQLVSGSTLTITYPMFTAPGTNNGIGLRNPTATPSISISGTTPFGSLSQTILGGTFGSTTIAAVTTSMTGGPLYTNGGAPSGASGTPVATVGSDSFFATGGGIGATVGSNYGGGGGGAGISAGGGGGAASSSLNGGNGGLGGTGGQGQYGAGGGGGASSNVNRPGRGGFGRSGYVKIEFS